MFYTVNVDLQTAHTVIAGSKTEKKIIENPNQKMIVFNGHFHKIFKSVSDAKTYLSLLMLHGSQT